MPGTPLPSLLRRAWVLALLFVLVITPAPRRLQAQQNYAQQVTAIEQMLTRKQYRRAERQSQALTETGREQQLPEVEALGHYLHARALLEDSPAEAERRVAGLRSLRLAAATFEDTGLSRAVDSIVGALRERAATDEALPALPPVRALQAVESGFDADGAPLDEEALNAIVAVQNRRIEALTDSQMRQLLRIQQQEMAIDSFRFHALNDSVELMRQALLLEEQRSLTNEERLRRNFLLLLALGVATALGLLYLRYRSGLRYQERLRDAQARTDELLLNILPRQVARELRETGRATARRHASVTVLFVDFVGFSRVAGTHDPAKLVELLDRTFRAFDDITETHGLEKIKTIGDAYMCVCGVPEPVSDHADRAVAAALEIQEYLACCDDFQARIGIHSGPVVAGVVGRRKFAFDVWGDTVNQAARLEEIGTAGEITVSKATCDLLSDTYTCEYLGTFEAKNIGSIDRYRVRDSRLMKKPS